MYMDSDGVLWIDCAFEGVTDLQFLSAEPLFELMARAAKARDRGEWVIHGVAHNETLDAHDHPVHHVELFGRRRATTEELTDYHRKRAEFAAHKEAAQRAEYERLKKIYEGEK